MVTTHPQQFVATDARDDIETLMDVYNNTDLYLEIRYGGGVTGMGLLELSINTINPLRRIVSLH